VAPSGRTHAVRFFVFGLVVDVWPAWVQLRVAYENLGDEVFIFAGDHRPLRAARLSPPVRRKNQKIIRWVRILGAGRWLTGLVFVGISPDGECM